MLAEREACAQSQQLLGTHRIKADLVEEAQQPGLAVAEVRALPEAVPHLDGAADELVAARAFHAIHAQIGAADAHGILGRPGAGRVVLGGDQSMTRVQRRGHGRAQVHIAQAHHQVAGAVDDVLDLLLAVEPVDAADELDVARAPGRIRVHRLHVALRGQLHRRIVPGQRQVDDAAGQFHVFDIGQSLQRL